MSYLITETDIRGVTTLTLNRPEVFNAMDRQLIDELSVALQQLDGKTRILVLAANGKHFCSGADINWMRRSQELSDENNKEDALALAKLLNTLNTLHCPTVAKVHGAALAGGTGVVCCCDIVVATTNARFSLSETRLGLIPATISPYVLEAIGARAARRYFLSAEQISAEEAHRLGIAHELCRPDTLDNCVEEKINSLLQCGPGAQTAAKQLIADVANQTNNEQLREQLATRLATIRTSDEAQEGLSAFLEKRTPNWAS